MPDHCLEELGEHQAQHELDSLYKCSWSRVGQQGRQCRLLCLLLRLPLNLPLLQRLAHTLACTSVLLPAPQVSAATIVLRDEHAEHLEEEVEQVEQVEHVEQEVDLVQRVLVPLLHPMCEVGMWPALWEPLGTLFNFCQLVCMLSNWA